MMRLADHVSWRLRSGGTASCSFLLGCIPSRGNILNNVGAPEHTSQSYGTGFFLKKLVYTCTIGSEFFAHILLSLRSNNFFFLPIVRHALFTGRYSSVGQHGCRYLRLPSAGNIDEVRAR